MKPQRLVDLDPFFIRWEREADGSYVMPHVSSLDEAQGIVFRCICETHSLLVWFADRGVPDDAPGPKPRWKVSGTSFADLSLAPSINLDVGSPERKCRWHGFVSRGLVT